MNFTVTAFTGFDFTCLAAGTVAAEARQRIALRLAGWGLAHLSSDLQLIATELITNACEARPDGHVRVRLTLEPNAVLLCVWDGSDRMPQAQPVDELEPDDLDLRAENWDRNGGWGLQLVRALSSGCGVCRTEPRGKWIWARLFR